MRTDSLVKSFPLNFRRRINLIGENLISGLAMIDDGFGKNWRLSEKKMEELTMTTDKNWPSSPVNVTDSEFQNFVKKYPRAIVDCWAPWCGPCRNLSPIIDELAGVYKGKVAFGKLNTDDNQKTAMSFGIMSIPSIGAPPRPALEAKINAFMK
jgi:thioredoxin 1